MMQFEETNASISFKLLFHCWDGGDGCWGPLMLWAWLVHELCDKSCWNACTFVSFVTGMTWYLSVDLNHWFFCGLYRVFIRKKPNLKKPDGIIDRVVYNQANTLIALAVFLQHSDVAWLQAFPLPSRQASNVGLMSSACFFSKARSELR